jgi:hypothetical protein
MPVAPGPPELWDRFSKWMAEDYRRNDDSADLALAKARRVSNVFIMDMKITVVSTNSHKCISIAHRMLLQ